MGSGFILVFNLIAWCTRVDGITTATIANKLSLVIPAFFSIVLWDESAGALKIAGILLAFPAIYLTTKTPDARPGLKSLVLPACLFIGGGLLDTCMNFVQKYFLLLPNDPDHYAIFCFSVAGTIGTALIVVLALLKKIRLQPKNILAGICVGIPNYFSIYFFVKMLHSPVMESSASIPVLNIGILVASTIVAVLAFKEKMNIARATGLALSLLAIVMIAYSAKAH